MVVGVIRIQQARRVVGVIRIQQARSGFSLLLEGVGLIHIEATLMQVCPFFVHI